MRRLPHALGARRPPHRDLRHAFPLPRALKRETQTPASRCRSADIPATNDAGPPDPPDPTSCSSSQGGSGSAVFAERSMLRHHRRGLARRPEIRLAERSLIGRRQQDTLLLGVREQESD
jgi:hypothetical protein